MSIKLKGSSDGSVSFDAPADTSPSGSDITLTLPTTVGSANQFLKNSGIAGELEYSSMVETSTGVGIGTSAPAQKLSIEGGNLQITNTTEGYLYFTNSPTANRRSYIAAIEDAGNSNNLTFGTNANGFDGVEKMRLTPSGRLLVGTSSSRTSAVTASNVQIEGTGAGSGLSILRHGSGNGSYLQLASTGGNAIGSTTATPSQAPISQIVFAGSDGSSIRPGAYISAENDQGAAWASNDCPARLMFSTTADAASSPTERMRIDSDGRLISLPTYNATSGSSGNVGISSSGKFYRSTSSGKYKTNVETIDDTYADALLNCRPVWYRSLCADDNPEHGYWGFIAEEVADIDPRLVYYKTTETTYDENGSAVEAPCEPEPEGVQYDRFVPHLLNLIKRQKATIAAQQAQIDDLLARVTALEAA